MKKLVVFKVLTLLILLLPISSYAQSKGYLGRRFVVQTDLFLSRNHENKLFSWSVFNPRVQFAPGLEYAVGHKTAFGCSFNMFKFAFDPTSSIEYMFQDSLEEKLFMNGLGFHLYLKTYLFRGSHAPYGLFLKFAFDWNSVTINSQNFGVLKDRIYGTHLEIGYDLRVGKRYRISWGTFFKMTNELSNIFITKRPTLIELAQKKIFKDFLIGTKLSFSFLAF